MPTKTVGPYAPPATLRPFKFSLDNRDKIGYISDLRLGWRPRAAGNTVAQRRCLAQAPQDLPQR